MKETLFGAACWLMSMCRVADPSVTVVAVIDTGISPNTPVKVCPHGSFNFINDTADVTDYHGHGTNVSGLIDQSAHDKNYCQMILKYYSDTATGKVNEQRMIRALQAAVNAKADYINISGGGPEPDPTERALVEKALDNGTVIVAAAGNEGVSLDKKCNYYPACYDKRIIVVGNLGLNGHRAPSSNWGKIVKHFIVGENRCALGICSTGTSQATAIVTGRLVRDDYKIHVDYRRRVDSK